MTESIYEFHRENGRTYHAYRAGCEIEVLARSGADADCSAYHYPNDSIEVERLEHQHEILKMLLDGRNYLAPWSRDNPPRKVLDIATGTGRWAVEVADEFPQYVISGSLCFSARLAPRPV